MSDAYAYQVWICSCCGNECHEEGGGLVSEVCGKRFEIRGDRAVLLPDEDED